MTTYTVATIHHSWHYPPPVQHRNAAGEVFGQLFAIGFPIALMCALIYRWSRPRPF